MGLSRDTFYRYKQALSEGGVQALGTSNNQMFPVNFAVQP